MSAPTLTADLHRHIARLELDLTRVRLELVGARQVIQAHRDTKAGTR